MKIGTTDVSKLYFGSTEVTKVYLGTTEVYSSSVEPAPQPQPTTGDTLVLMHFDDSTNVAAADKVEDVSVVVDTGMPATIDTADFKFGTGSLASGNKSASDVTITLPETEPSVWTAECWVKGNSTKGNATFSTLTKNDSAVYNGFSIQHQYNKGTVKIRTANNTDTLTNTTMTNTMLTTPDWIHIALVKLEDGTMYLGSSGTLMQVTTLPSWSNVFYIGLNKADSFTRTPCNVDEFRISKSNTLKDFNIEKLTYTVPTEAFTFSGESSGGDSGGETPTTGNNPVVYTKEKETLTIPAGVYTELDGAKRSVKVTDTTALSVSDVSSLYINVNTAKPTLIQTGSLAGNELDTNIYLGKIDMSAADYTYLWVENANISFTDSEESGGGESGGGSSGGGSETPAENTAWKIADYTAVVYTLAGVEIKDYYAEKLEGISYAEAIKTIPSIAYADSGCKTLYQHDDANNMAYFIVRHDNSYSLAEVSDTVALYIGPTATKVPPRSDTGIAFDSDTNEITIQAGTYAETDGQQRVCTLAEDVTEYLSVTGNYYLNVDTNKVEFVFQDSITGSEEKTSILLCTVTLNEDTGICTYEVNTNLKYTP